MTDSSERIELIKSDARRGLKWQPVVGQETLALIDSLGIPEDSRPLLVEEASLVLGQCTPPNSAAGSETGLVIGYVQSGKTVSFTTVAALARDSAYQLIIVIAGSSVPLLKQSTDRLAKDLRLNTRPDRKWNRFINPTPNDVKHIRNTLADWDDASVPINEKRAVLITVMKNATHLDNLVGVLSELPLERRPAIVIDDEADQAGLNTGVRKGRESPTYQRLLSVRAALPHHSYLQYTATPQAPLLINLIDALSPRFAALLTPGDDYVGGREFFTGEDELVRPVPLDEIPSPSNLLVEPPESLIEALRLFFLGVAAGFIRDAGNGNRSMLVHPSQSTYLHGQYFDWVSGITQSWLATLSLPSTDPDRLELLEDLRLSYAELDKTVKDLPHFDELLEQLRRAIRQVRIEEVNTRGGETPQIDWKATYPFILVGGQAMDRGFTVEGLTVTYMPRGLGVGNADNVQQRARFLGYKRRYLGYCRVFLESAARDAYRDYVVHEDDVRDRLRAHIEEGKPLLDWKREFFLTRKLKPTRRSVLGLDYMRLSFGDEWWNPSSPHDTHQAIVSNRDIVREFLAKLVLVPDAGHRDRSEFMKHQVDHSVSLADTFEHLLTKYRVTSPEDSQRFTALRLMIQRYLEEKPASLCSVFYMGGGLERKREADADGNIDNLFQGAHPDTRGSIYPGDRKIRSDAGLTVQIHKLRVQTADGLLEDVPTIAVWMPREMNVDLLIQDEPTRA